MQLKKAGKGICKTILFMGILVGLLFGTQEILKLNMGHRGTDSVKGFYEEENNSIEVLFIGASTMFCTADPLVLYEEYGITSYDYGSSAQPFELSYLFMQEALKTQKPKVIALEMLSVVNEFNPDKAESLNYGITDLHFSKEKVSEVMEMFREDKGEGLSYLVPMAQYKDRWQELEKEDFIGDYESYANYAKGAYTPDKIAEVPLDFSSYYEEEACQLPQRNIEVFEKMLALCEKNGVELMLFKSPNIGWNIGQTKAVEKLAADYGVPFLDFYPLMEELGINYQNDFRDNTHFNRFGSEKASIYLGSYLKDHYELTDYRVPDVENSWDIALKNREHDRANEALGRISGLPDYMSAIPYEGYTVVFNVTGDVSGMEDFIRELAKAFGLEEEMLLEGGSFAVQGESCVSGLVGTSGGEWSMELDTNSLKLTGYSITYNRETYQLVDDGLTILIYDNDWKQFVDIVGFDAYDPAHGVRP